MKIEARTEIKYFYGVERTNHYTNDRNEREALIIKLGTGEVVNTFWVDKGHYNGAEIHQITTTGMIVIFNERTRKMVTKLIARPAQITRYYQETGLTVNYNLLVKAWDNQKKGYNHI